MVAYCVCMLIFLFAAPWGVIDVNLDELISLSQLARRLPRRRKGRPVAPSTIHRWRLPGIRGFSWTA